MRELKLQVPMHVIDAIKDYNIIFGNPSPSNIDIFTMTTKEVTSELFWCCYQYHSTPLQSFKIGLYNYGMTTMDLFGPAATPPLIQLSAHGIVGLEHNVFHLNEYCHNGTIRHVIIPRHDLHRSFTEERNFTYTSHLHTVSYVDVSF